MSDSARDWHPPTWLALVGWAVIAVLAVFACIAAIDGEWGVALLDGLIVGAVIWMALDH